MKTMMGDVFLAACGSGDFLGLLAALDAGELLAATSVAFGGLVACGLSVVVTAAGVDALLDFVFFFPSAMGSACGAVTGAVRARSCEATLVASFVAAGFSSGVDLIAVAFCFARLGGEGSETVLVPLLSAVLVAAAERGCLSLPELPVWPSLSAVRFFFSACSVTLSFSVAALRAVFSALLFFDVSFLA